MKLNDSSEYEKSQDASQRSKSQTRSYRKEVVLDEDSDCSEELRPLNSQVVQKKRVVVPSKAHQLDQPNGVQPPLDSSSDSDTSSNRNKGYSRSKACCRGKFTFCFNLHTVANSVLLLETRTPWSSLRY